MKTRFAVIIGVPLLTLFLGIVGQVSAADISDYSITPPFVQETVRPNLLMMIDNSASMYDLQYQDTTNTYCANSPTTACTAGTTCGGTAYCLASTTTSTTTSKAACTTDAQCSALLPGDTCNTGKNECKNATVTVTTVNPVACTTDTTCSALTAGDTCNNKCNSTRQCYDTTYDTATTYAGYFDATATYSYDFTNNKFTSGASMPGTCTYSAGTTKYLCVNTSGSGTSETIATSGSGFVASGNFLNWLTASKFDIQKKILTGGKFNTSSNVLVAESRGCAGREFIKAVPGVALTFSIRGGTPGGIGSTQSLATEYGQTYIEIYTGAYNAGACLAAMNDWMNVVSGNPPNLGTFQNDTKDCVGSGSSALNAVNMWNHVLHDCYQGMTGGAQGYSTNLNALEGECAAVYSTISPSSITDPNLGISICSKALTYTLGGINYKGYLGTWWNGTNFSGPSDPLSQSAITVEKQMENYCKINVNTNPVIDPSSTAVTGSVASASIPGFVMQQGLTTLPKVGTLTVQVSATAPTGLIEQFKNQIRFGAMIFNTDGSLSECGTGNVPCSRYCSSTKTRLCYFDSDCPSGETCPAYDAANNKDSGKIIAFVGAGTCSSTTSTACTVNSDCPSGESCQPSVGDHSSGLIKAIDDTQATTWTPHAEAFYNAIAYFVKDATATTPALPSTFAPSTATASSSVPINAPLSGSDSYTNKNPIQIRC